MPTVNPAPVCTNGVSSKVMWEVKYEIRLTSGAVLSGVLPTKIARVFTGVYCPSPTPTPTPTPTPDVERPVIVAGSGVVEKSTVKFEESFTFTFRVTDNTEVYSAGGIVYRPDQWPVKEVDGGVLISGNSQDGTWRVTIHIPRVVNKSGIENNPIGTYSVYAKARDLVNNVTRLDGNYYVYIGTISVSE